MDCVELAELVTAFLEDALDTTTEQRVVEHLSLCDGCTTYVAQFRSTVERLGHLPADDVAELPEPSRAALLAAFRKKGV
ncbi:anti-sigma factor family protein [Pseudonocardia sp. TRM90224]|uniref:anti-sigma factor family protein n=1 Tax=Pseudonocardia sp. TRM90224 TaxID=2812678 RepID=UPI001E61A867|nr:zf-HC2 domain-containing protein [Pseudonocardia sp. TRM90224]